MDIHKIYIKTTTKNNNKNLLSTSNKSYDNAVKTRSDMNLKVHVSKYCFWIPRQNDPIEDGVLVNVCAQVHDTEHAMRVTRHSLTHVPL